MRCIILYTYTLSFSKSLSSFVTAEDSSRRSLMKNDSCNHFYIFPELHRKYSRLQLNHECLSLKNQLVKKPIRISHIVEFIYVHCGQR
jgi:hypothetical protein